MTGDDLVEAKLGVRGLPFQRKRPDGSPMFPRAFLGLAQGTVRYVGEPVAFVVAETLPHAKDASMGRLTLNVLLSFAQFEREVIGERIRDKIAASKKKGMWMGGVPPLGYQAQDRKLII